MVFEPTFRKNAVVRFGCMCTAQHKKHATLLQGEDSSRKDANCAHHVVCCSQNRFCDGSCLTRWWFETPKIPILTSIFSDGLKKTTNQPTNWKDLVPGPTEAFTHHQRPSGATMSVHGQQRRLEEVRSERGGW